MKSSPEIMRKREEMTAFSLRFAQFLSYRKQISLFIFLSLFCLTFYHLLVMCWILLLLDSIQLHTRFPSVEFRALFASFRSDLAQTSLNSLRKKETKQKCRHFALFVHDLGRRFHSVTDPFALRQKWAYRIVRALGPLGGKDSQLRGEVMIGIESSQSK